MISTMVNFLFNINGKHERPSRSCGTTVSPVARTAATKASAALATARYDE